MQPLDDQPARAIARRARAARGEVEENYRRRVRPGDAEDDPQPEDIERFSDPTVRCPACGREMLDEMEICPHCGHAVHERERHRPLPAVAAVVAVLLIVAMLILLALTGRPLFG